jgi:hypothetical protein
MPICEWCEQEYEQSKWWQRFCSKHKDDWHNHQKSLALREAAEDEREARLEGFNGDAPHKPLREILQGLTTKPEPSFSFKRRSW